MPPRRKKKYAQNKAIGNARPPYLEYNPHTGKAPIMKNQNILVVSIDPGVTNCGIYVGYYDTVTEIHKTLHLERLEFNDGINPYISSLEKLDEMEKDYCYFSAAHYIVIESQMHNVTLNTRMCQHLITYFITKYKDKGNKAIVVEIAAQAKYRLLGCPMGLDKADRKRWSPKRAIELLEERECEDELIHITEIRSSTKRDDMADALCQYHAFFKMLNGEFGKPTMPTRV
jgi:hypothetical protein